MNGSRFARGPVAGLVAGLFLVLAAPPLGPLLAQESAAGTPAQSEAMPTEPMPAEPMPAEPLPEGAQGAAEGAGTEGEGGAAPGAQGQMTESPEPPRPEAPTEAAQAPGAEPPAEEQAGAGEPTPTPLPVEGEAEGVPEEKALEMAPPPEPPAPPPLPVVERAPRGRDVLEIGTDFRGPGYRQVTGLIYSGAHGRRLVRTFVSPPAAAKIYRKNAAKVRQGVESGLLPFPEGTIIVQESFARTRNGAPGAPGPLFVMKKETRGYDPSGNDWRYAFAQPDLELIGDGTGGSVASCKACHTGAQERDFVMASDR